MNAPPHPILSPRLNSRVTAVLGPTNTGKTHYAIERMLGHRTGVIGLPLRLLAREVYDRIVKARGPSVVALVTGEERIVPDRAQYWVCTVEAMPEGMGTDFLAVDEVQLCADPERGHVFTDRLLHWRGRQETMFLGSDTMRGAIAALVDDVTWIRRERFSTLSYTGSKKISRLPERAAIVGFSVENVYAIAEYIRRTRGGAAVVMGALSPRTRNAQVALYQNGDVDYLVATDAIGLGLNLDIAHVAFSSLTKFDGVRMRALGPDELAQIAGRAGRHLSPGTFGVTGEAQEPEPDVIAAIESHQFRPIGRLQWRNARLQFGSVGRLIQSLEERTTHPWLTRVRDSDDLTALKALADDPEIRARASDGRAVRLLWDVCRIPDFRGISHGEHAALLGTIFRFLHQSGQVPADFLAAQIQRIDRTEGDIDTLSKRLAYIRTWTYVAQRHGWTADESHWRGETRAVEDRLSDALHEGLTQRFVDRRTSVLARRLRQKEVLVAEVNDTGEVSVEGEFVGRLEGFRFRIDKSGSPDEARTLRQAAAQALAPHFHLRADRFYNAPDTEMDFTEQGGLMWGTAAVGRLTAGPDPLRPQVVAFVDDEAGPDVAAKVQRRLQHFIDRKIATAMEPLLALQRDDALTGLARGFAYRLVENFGIIPRGDVTEDVRALDQEARAALRKHGVRFGQFTVFLPPVLKPAPTRLRLVLWGLAKGLDEFPESPPAGHVTVPATRDAVPGYYAMAGFRAAGERAVRIDMLERLADQLRERDARAGFEAVPAMLSITGLSLEQFAGLMSGLGYRADRRERPKVKAAPEGPASTPIPDPSATSAAYMAPGMAGEVEPDASSGTPQDAVPEPAPDASAESPTGSPEGPATGPVSAVAAEAEAQDAGTTPEATPEAAPDMLPAAGASDASHPAADEGPLETEVYYFFTRSARPPRREKAGADGPSAGDKGRGKPRGRGAERAETGGSRAGGAEGAKAAPEAQDAQHRRAHEDKSGHRRGGKPGGKGAGKPGSKGPRQGDTKPQVFAATPPRDNAGGKGAGRGKAIDPDNPFAAALAGFKAK